jgi:DNA-binding MarR family transcriptional regulator
LWTAFADEFARRISSTRYADIRAAHGQVFAFIDDEGTRLTDLANRAGISKQAMGELVSDLERAGYLERVPDPRDTRAKLIRTTDKGERQIEASWTIIRAVEERWAAKLGKSKMKALREMLGALVDLEKARAQDRNGDH